MQQRIQYQGMPTAGGLSPDLQNILDTDLNSYRNASDLRGARAAIDQAIQADQIGEGDMLPALQFMRNSEGKLAELAQSQKELMKRAKASGPAVVKSIGDSTGSLARSFSITEAISRVVDGRQLEGAELEAHQEAKREYPAARGSVLVPAALRTELRNVYGNDSTQSGIDANVSGRQTLSTGTTLLARHFVPMSEQLGSVNIDATGAATMLVPYLGRTDAATAQEGAAATSSASFQELSLSPTRYTRKASVSDLALRTTGQQLDRILLDDFDRAHAAAHDKVVFAAIRDNATFTAATDSGSGLAATTLADLFNLMKDTMNATGTSGYFDLLASPLAMTVLNTKIVTSSDQTLAQMFVAQTGRSIIPVVSMADATFTAAEVLGDTTANDIAGAGYVVAGDMSAAVRASWGGLSLTVDEYSLRDNAVINVHCDSYVAAGIVSDAFRILAVASADIAAA